MPSFIKIVQVVKKLNSISRERLTFRRRPFLCTTLYRNLMKASNFGGTFDQLFLEFFMKFSQKMPLYVFYTMVQKVKNDQEFKVGFYYQSLNPGRPTHRKLKITGEYPLLAFFQRCSKGLFIHSYVTISNLLARFQTPSMVFDATTPALISLSPQLTTGF